MPICVECRGTIRRARVVINGHVVCPDCAYTLAYGEAERAPVDEEPGPPQVETLFPVAPYVRAKGG